jgi:hypothetical protein
MLGVNLREPLCQGNVEHQCPLPRVGVINRERQVA